MNVSEELIAKCIDHDQSSQKELYLLMLPYLKSIVVRYLYSGGLVQDCLQDTFVKIFQNLKGFDKTKGEFKSWAARIAINTALNLNRQEQRKTSTDPHDLILPVSPDVLDKMSGEALLKVLKRMPENYFEAFSLHVLDGFEHKEISDILGISESLSRKRVSRARSWLAKMFDTATRELKKRSFKVLL